jgi:hypothetical protein
MSKILFVSACLVSILFYSCSPELQVSTDCIKGTDFKKYKSYAWLSPDSSLTDNQDLSVALGNMIMSISNEELKKKGMVLDTENPDVLFNYKFGTKIVTRYSQSASLSVGVGVAGPGYYVGGSVPVAGGEIMESQDQQAQLDIRMFETKSGQVLWTGVATKTVDQAGNNGKKNLQIALHNMFYKLPIRHKAK